MNKLTGLVLTLGNTPKKANMFQFISSDDQLIQVSL
jgi:hypothetical protein